MPPAGLQGERLGGAVTAFASVGGAFTTLAASITTFAASVTAFASRGTVCQQPKYMFSNLWRVHTLHILLHAGGPA